MGREDIVLCAASEWVGDEESGRSVKSVGVGVVARDDILESVRDILNRVSVEESYSSQ